MTEKNALDSTARVFEIVRVDRRLYTWHFEFRGTIRFGYGNRRTAIKAADRWIRANGGSDVR